MALLIQVKPWVISFRIFLGCPRTHTRRDLGHAFGRATSQDSPALVETSTFSLTTAEISKAIRTMGTLNCMVDERCEWIRLVGVGDARKVYFAFSLNR